MKTNAADGAVDTATEVDQLVDAVGVMRRVQMRDAPSPASRSSSINRAINNNLGEIADQGATDESLTIGERLSR